MKFNPPSGQVYQHQVPLKLTQTKAITTMLSLGSKTTVDEKLKLKESHKLYKITEEC
jgi:hypothetical protein